MHMGSFVKIKSSRNGKITLSCTDIGKSCPSSGFLRRKYVFNAIRENNMLAKFSIFTVCKLNILMYSQTSIIRSARDHRNPFE